MQGNGLFIQPGSKGRGAGPSSGKGDSGEKHPVSTGYAGPLVCRLTTVVCGANSYGMRRYPLLACLAICGRGGRGAAGLFRSRGQIARYIAVRGRSRGAAAVSSVTAVKGLIMRNAVRGRGAAN